MDAATTYPRRSEYASQIDRAQSYYNGEAKPWNGEAKSQPELFGLHSLVACGRPSLLAFDLTRQWKGALGI